MPKVSNFPLGEICKWLKHADCKSVLYEFAGSNPALTTILKTHSQEWVFFMSCSWMQAGAQLLAYARALWVSDIREIEFP